MVCKVIECEVVARDARACQALIENEIRPGRGLRQGMPLSPILSNFVLRNFDRVISDKHSMVRYADDLILLARSRGECEGAAALVETELAKLGLKLSIEKTEIHDPSSAVEFLGMELRLSKGSQNYELVVSDEQIYKIRDGFRALHNWDAASKDGLDITKLLRRLEQMKAGYASAYDAADNSKILNEKLERWAQECAKKVYSSIFGPERVSALTDRQKQFLHLP